jgi:hypothetical protein
MNHRDLRIDGQAPREAFGTGQHDIGEECDERGRQPHDDEVLANRDRDPGVRAAHGAFAPDMGYWKRWWQADGFIPCTSFRVGMGKRPGGKKADVRKHRRQVQIDCV